MTPEDDSPTDELVLLGSIEIEVYLDTDGSLIHAANIEGLEPYQAVGIMEHAKMDLLYFPTADDDDD